MKQLPRQKRTPQAVSFSLVARDLDILRSLARYRYLRTSQIKRLHFSENKSIQSARRRLKYLYHHGYVGRIEALVQMGHGSSETAYYIDKKGRDLLSDEIDFSSLPKKQDHVKPQYLNHTLDVSEFQITLTQSLTDHPVASLARFIADFEIKSHTNRAIGRKRYKLFNQIDHPISDKTYTVYPDALFILRGKGKSEGYQRLYFVEIDRGTEGLKVITDKITGYRLYHELGIFKNFGKFMDFRVLIQTTSERRVRNMWNVLLDHNGSERVWITDEAKVSPDTLLEGDIWLDNQQSLRHLVKPNFQEQPR